MARPDTIAFVGCGYVADFYRRCYQQDPNGLTLRGVYDRDPARLKQFCEYWGDRAYGSLEELLSDPEVGLVVNLTNPENHAPVTQAALQAGKNVYSEKPLGLSAGEAERLMRLAQENGVRLAGAPCNHLGASAQTLKKAVEDRRIGDPLLVYAELDDGMIHRADYENWLSRSGKPWPAADEFETGCTYEHAGYVLSILISIFGPVRTVTSQAALLVPDKHPDLPAEHCAPDFSCGILEFDQDVVARVTNSIIAPYDHRLRIVGTEGTLEVNEIWDYSAPVTWRPTSTGRIGRSLERRFGYRMGRRLPLVNSAGRRKPVERGKMNFMRGVKELADAVESGRTSSVDAELVVHITEVTEALQHPDRFARPHRVSAWDRSVPDQPVPDREERQREPAEHVTEVG